MIGLRYRQLTTLYSRHMASESLTLLVMRLSIVSGKWKVLLVRFRTRESDKWCLIPLGCAR